MTQASCDPGYRLVNSEVRDLTKEFAEEFATLEGSPTERALDSSRVKHLREKAEAGQLITFLWSTVKIHDKVLRMNGQHSSKMLTGLNGLFPEGLKVHFDQYEAKDDAAMATLFRQFDDRKSGRSSADVAGAYQGLEEALKNVPRSVAKVGAEGIAWHWLHVEGTSGISGDDRYIIMNKPAVHPFLQWLGELFTIKTPELKRDTIVAAIYATYLANEQEARKFWLEVARGGEGYEDNAPTTRLDAWLKSLAENKDAREGMKPGMYYQGCIFAWNAYRDNKTLNTIKCDIRKGLHEVSE